MEQNKPPFILNGKWQYRTRSLFNLWRSTLSVSARRLLHGPRYPNWSWSLETSTHFMRAQASASFDMSDMSASREYDDALLFSSTAVDQVNIEPVKHPIQGHWFTPKSGAGPVCMLYLHGGGYAYYSKVHENLIARVALAANARTFALDYRLIPEHPYPAQLQDALAAYRWLLETGIDPRRLLVAGDSAGGNLTLALLLALKDAGLPLPALGLCLAPWTDPSDPGESMTINANIDWIEKRLPLQWAKWFTKGSDARDPLISPVYADLRGLPPVYIQVGSVDILYNMILAFAERAKAQGAPVRLDVWENMTHDFQAYGELLPESQEALLRIGQVVAEHTA